MRHLKLYEEFQNEGLRDWLAKAAKVVGGIALAPKFMEILGWAAGSINKSIDSPEIKQAADFLIKHGKDLQDKYTEVVGNAISPMLKDPSQKDRIAQDLILAISGKKAGEMMHGNQQLASMQVLVALDQKHIVDNAMKLLPSFQK